MLTREVEISDAEFGAFDMHWQVDFTASGEVLDVAIAAVLWSTRDRPGALLSDLLLDVVKCAAGMHIDGLWWLGNNAVHGVGRDEFSFSSVPFGEYFGGWCTAQNARVDETGEADMGDVAGGTEDAFEVPDCFCSTSLSAGDCDEAPVYFAYALGYNSSRNPPPFFLSNTPVNPQGWSWKG
jgi:hypothetical protein